jgi:Mce-associated membrane protein
MSDDTDTAPDTFAAPRSHGRHRRQGKGDGVTSRRRRVPAVVLVVLTVLCIAVAALDVLVLTRLQDRDRSDDARADAVAAARTAATEILSYDYRSLDKDIAKAKSDATGKFLREYSSTAGRLLEQAKQLKAVVQASVASTAVVSAKPNTVVVLAFVDQATVKSGDKQTRIDQNRVRMTMQRVKDRWLVSELDAL